MLLDNAHFRLELPDSWIYHPHYTGDGRAAVDRDLPSELIVDTWTTHDDSDLDEAMVKLSELRLQAAEEEWGAALEQDCVDEHDAQGTLRRVVRSRWGEQSSYYVAFAHHVSFAGTYAIVSFAFYFYDAVLSLDMLSSLYEPVLSSLTLLPDAKLQARLAASNDEPLDPARVYPYIVTSVYFEKEAEPPELRALGHDCHVALIEDLDGVARLLYPATLPLIGGGDWAELTERALANLEGLLQRRGVSIGMIDGPRQQPLLVFGPESFAAACLLLPSLPLFAAEHLGPGPLCATVPHRDALVVLRAGDAPYRAEVLEFVRQAEAHGRKRLTDALFSLTPTGPVPFTV